MKFICDGEQVHVDCGKCLAFHVTMHVLLYVMLVVILLSMLMIGLS